LVHIEVSDSAYAMWYLETFSIKPLPPPLLVSTNIIKIAVELYIAPVAVDRSYVCPLSSANDAHIARVKSCGLSTAL